MLARLAFLALLLAFAPASAVPSAHYVPQVNDSFTFHETIAVRGGTGNYSGYTETDAINGTVNVTAVLSNGTETASYAYAGHYWNSDGADYPWTSSGSFTFSARTFDYVTGTDNQTGDEGSEVWFYMNNSLSVGSTIAPLTTEMTVDSRATSYVLDTSAGTYVSTIYADGTGTYVRDDSYGVFPATYDWRAYFDPSTGYIVGYDDVELDADSHGNGFVYTDTLAVTKTTYGLTPASAPSTYPVTFTETGLGAGTSWTVTFDGAPQSGTGSTISFPAVADGTYLFGVSSPGGSADPAVGLLTVNGAGNGVAVTFAAGSSSPATNAWLLYVVLAIVVVVLVVVIAIAAARRSRRGPPLPRHSAGGVPRYATPPLGPAPPPISLAPGDQPRIQQIVVKEVVKVNCRYCGSLIDSTAEKCPFCGATRT
jgi:hypothetical protein